MKWSPEQDSALQQVADWLKGGDEQVFRLFGYAGTGKTTLARHFAEGVEGGVLFAAFTGKAAHVLRTKGCPGASTIHSLIYHSKDKGRAHLKELEAKLAEEIMILRNDPSVKTMQREDQDREISQCKHIIKLRSEIEKERESLSQPMFTLNLESVVKNNELIVIDECSMVDGRMGQDLLSFGTKVLVLGDPAQLPPVGGAGFFTENVKPDIMLEDIHRQAADNPIISMATKVRNQESLHLGKYGDSIVMDRSQCRTEDVLAADQVLVGKNKTRRASNMRVRELKGYNNRYPQEGERLVCLKNNHDKALLNGATYTVDTIGDVDESDDTIYMTLAPTEEGDLVDVCAHTHYFLGTDDQLHWTEKGRAEEFDYGYAMTTHKAQGSQWNAVYLFDESYCFRADRHRWLYTAITRAAEKITIVRD